MLDRVRQCAAAGRRDLSKGTPSWAQLLPWHSVLLVADLSWE